MNVVNVDKNLVMVVHCTTEHNKWENLLANVDEKKYSNIRLCLRGDDNEYSTFNQMFPSGYEYPFPHCVFLKGPDWYHSLDKTIDDFLFRALLEKIVEGGCRAPGMLGLFYSNVRHFDSGTRIFIPIILKKQVDRYISLDKKGLR